ncbi:hypothetical protein LTR37_015777 [Vermiconidia calcicola]|uniref:Uncharacterized protein n=1 Tax=Vermiconidia calcicola TaxID=1690605 RepID=A0ACC3MPS4_9PEZI|nr:hypothetical protein LTR37_015777 [Vermiconidia calcicola]
MAPAGSEDDDLELAIAMSLTEAANDDHAGDCHTSFAGLDRKAMEEERLARQRARKRDRSISPPALKGSRKAPKLEEKTVALPSGARLTPFSTLVDDDQRGRKTGIANAATERLKQPQPSTIVKQEVGNGEDIKAISGSRGILQYPRGVVKKTWAFGFERTGNDVKLEEVLEPRTLKTAVLSAFQWNTDWVLGKLKIPPNGGNTKCVFIMQAEGDALRQQMMRETEGMRSFLRLCLPPMDGQIHCMHSKLMLLFHPEKLRVAIPTANLLDFDWGETGVMENSVFMIDLPRLPGGGKQEASKSTPFCKEMLHYLEKQGLDEDIRSGVLNFDFSATDGMMFVHTAGGISFGEDAERTGLPGLARAVRQLGLPTNEDLQIDFAASSIGSLNDDQLRSLHAAARGEDLIAKAKGAASNAKAEFFKPPVTKSPSEGTNIRDKIQIYFPTKDTVRSSKAGAAGTICLSRRWWEEMRFPRICFRDYRSVRTGLLSHNKILYARGKQASHDGGVKDVAWAYVGSANMSESAWGKLVYDKKAKAWKVNCRNWECGVLLPIPAERIEKYTSNATEQPLKKEKIDGEDSETESDDESAQSDCGSRSNRPIGMEVFDDIVPPPFEVPGRTYDGREPWYFQESR